MQRQLRIQYPGSAAGRYNDATFALGGFTIASGNNAFTAGAQDALGRTDTNSITVNLPTTVTCTYDLNGNLTSDGTRGFDYDDENQLVRVTVTNSWKSEFVYDGKMRRQRVEYTWSGSAWLTNAVVRYVYDGNVVVQERDGNNLPLVTYTRGRDLSGTFQGAGGIGGLLARTDAGLFTIGSASAHSYYHADGNGNVTALINPNQAIVARYLYDPYGNILSQSGSLADANLYRFSSKEFHKASGLVYYLYRFYDPSSQRWLNRDSLGEPGFELHRYRTARAGHSLRSPAELSQGPNIYEFVDNTPVRFFDSYGLETEFCKKLGDTMNRLGRDASAAWVQGDTAAWKSLRDQVNNLGKAYKSLCTDDPPDPPLGVPVLCPVQGRRMPQDPYPPTNEGIFATGMGLAWLLGVLEEGWPVVVFAL